MKMTTCPSIYLLRDLALPDCPSKYDRTKAASCATLKARPMSVQSHKMRFRTRSLLGRYLQGLHSLKERKPEVRYQSVDTVQTPGTKRYELFRCMCSHYPDASPGREYGKDQQYVGQLRDRSPSWVTDKQSLTVAEKTKKEDQGRRNT